MVFEADQQRSYLETIHTVYPGIDVRSARLLSHDGEFNDILIVNGDLVFRFPRYTENIPGFLREIKLLAKLQMHLPLPIPQPIYHSDTSGEPGKTFMGYRLIQGQPLFSEVMNNITDEASLYILAEQLADFLTKLHQLPHDMLDLDIPVQTMPEWTHTFFGEVREHLFPLMRTDASLGLAGYFDNYFNSPDLQLYQPAIIHGDFGGSNVLFHNNRISGILDFSSVCYSDSALDIASVSTYGEQFF